MTFLIISHVEHKLDQDRIFGYAPYVREMNLWLRHADKIEIVAPKIQGEPTAIDMAYIHQDIKFNSIAAIQFTSILMAMTSLFKTPLILFTIFKACLRADHIHLRCPGNIGLLGCLVQILFPKKIKTAKYAGNWDPNATQPKSYRLQKKLLSNTFLSRNMQVLVYGAWKNQTKNIKPFFTATFSKAEIEPILERDYHTYLNFVFVGTLVIGKRPLLAIQIVEALHRAGESVHLDIYGDGLLRAELEQYIEEKQLTEVVQLHGNQGKEVVKSNLKQAHFLLLPSQSEGWPKAVAEAMFFGAIPIVTPISCVPYMLDEGKRGLIIEPNLKEALAIIYERLSKPENLKLTAKLASNWSQNYTLETFEEEIVKLLHKK